MTLTLEQMKANRKAWVEELRSGKHQQTTGALVDYAGYCCLGVACLVAGKTDTDIENDGTLHNFKDVRAFYGLRGADGDFDGSSLVYLNDDACKSFEEIAAVIESEPPGLFVETKTEAS